jgi:pyruvate dehydrogenase E2 component (dihydrolipoamide acetyltransferase)
MKKQNAIRRILATAAALVVVGALSAGATGCTSATSIAPAAVSQAAPAAPAPASAAAPAAAAPAQAAPAATGPTAADGQKVVQSSCIGRCHQSGLLKKRYSASSAQAIAADMGSKAGLSSGQQAAVVAYFAQ